MKHLYRILFVFLSFLLFVSNDCRAQETDRPKYTFGDSKIDMASYIHNLENNASSYMNYRMKKMGWTSDMCDEFQHAYQRYITEFKKPNATVRFKSDAFGTIYDNLGVLNDEDLDNYWYDKKGNQITFLQYLQLSERKKKKYCTFKANLEVARYFHLVARALEQKLKEKVTPSTQPRTHVAQSSEPKNKPRNIIGSGTGFLIDRRGYLATNYHVINGAGSIVVCLRLNGVWHSYEAVVSKTDPTNDLAIIRINDSQFYGYNSLPYYFTIDTENVASNIFTLGYPQVQVMGTDIKYTAGVINSRTGMQGDPTHYQISAHIDHGNSGGPLFNSNGFIIGITDSGLDKSTYGDVNYAIKSMYLKALIESLPISLTLPNDRSIALKSRTEQIRILSDYVALILIAK